ncbi:MAG: hypothetical protein R6V85_16550 [Polyangia bacterium]
MRAELQGVVAMRRTSWILALAIAGAALSIGPPVAAGDVVRCEVLSIEARNDGSGVDPALRSVLAEHATVLDKYPFSTFDSFKLVMRRAYELKVGSQAALTLPQPFAGRLSLEGWSAGKLDLSLSLSRGEGQPIVVDGNASPGTPFFAAGLASSGGTWIFGVLCDRAGGDGIVTH